MHYFPAQRLKLYRNFKSLRVDDFYGVVRYYEEYEEGIRTLDFDEYFDCTFTYANGLYQTGQYGKHIVMCDHLLELVIMENVETWGGGNVYAEILFKKVHRFSTSGRTAKPSMSFGNCSNYIQTTGLHFAP